MDRSRKRLKFPKYLAEVRPYAKTFMHITSSISHSNTVISIISPILQTRNLTFREVLYLPEVTLLIRVRKRIETQETEVLRICIT